MGEKRDRRWAKVCVGSLLGVAMLALVVLVGSPQGDPRPVDEPVIGYSIGAPDALLTKDAAKRLELRQRVLTNLNQLPISFEPNHGQTHKDVQFLSKGQGYTLFLTRSEAVVSMQKPLSGPQEDGAVSRPRGFQTSVLRIKFDGANAKPAMAGARKLPGIMNYLKGNDPEKWVREVPTYREVRYDEIYTGIDLVWYGKRGELEYDFVVAPGADPYVIGLTFEGLLAEEGKKPLGLDENGDLLLNTHGGVLRHKAPYIYQEVAGKRKQIPGRYVIKGDDRVGFQVAAYDKTRSLVIDPTVLYSTYISGTGGSGDGQDVVADASGNSYVTGDTTTADYPTAGTPYSSTNAGSNDAVVSALNPAGSALVYSTYIGGTDSDMGNGIDLGPSGNAFVIGNTSSTDFPTQNPFQASLDTMSDAFILVLDSTGSNLLYSTYCGGMSSEYGRAIAAVDTNRAYFCGQTYSSSGFPVTGDAVQNAFVGGSADGFFGVIDRSQSGANTLEYGTHFGTTGYEGLRNLTIDSSTGDVLLVGGCDSSGLPGASGTYQDTPAGMEDFTLTRFNDSGKSVTWTTYLGGTSDERGIYYADVVSNSGGDIFVISATRSSDFPVTGNAYSSTLQGTWDAFVTGFNSTGTSLNFSTFLGGTDNDYGTGIRLDSDSNICTAGYTFSSDFPTVNPAQAAIGGMNDGFLAVFDPVTGPMMLKDATFYGGSMSDYLRGLDVDPSGNMYVVGGGESADLPTVAPFQASAGGSWNLYTAKYETLVLGPTPGAPVTAVISLTTPFDFAPYTAGFDGSGSFQSGGTPTKRAITTYFWNFGDGNNATTASSTTTHTYTTQGVFRASLMVRTDVGDVSEPAVTPVVVGDGATGDSELYLSSASFGVSRTKDDSDSLKFRGYVNPNGFPADLSGASLILKINGQQIGGPVALSRSARRSARAGAGVIAIFSPSNGKFSVSGKGINLDDALSNVPDQTVKKKPKTLEIDMELQGVPTANTKQVVGVIKTEFSSKEGKSSKGKFSAIKLPTVTGFFKSIKTKASQGKSGGHKIVSAGAIEGDTVNTITPTGDITITIGGDGGVSTGAVFVLPFAELTTKGAGDKTTISYAGKKGSVPEIKKFQISNAKRKWVLSTDEINNTLIPATGTGQTAYELIVIISVPTAEGTQVFTTRVELKRKTDASTKWGR